MANHIEPVTKYSRPAKWLHWSIAILLLATFIFGVLLDSSTSDSLKFLLIKFHAPLGVAVGILILPRTYFAFTHPRPAPDPDWSPLIKWSSKIIHILLYILPLVLVISGLGIMAFSGLSDQLISGQTEIWPALNQLGPRQGHGLVSKLLLLAVALHIAGAIYHQFVVKDNLLARMK